MDFNLEALRKVKDSLIDEVGFYRSIKLPREEDKATVHLGAEYFVQLSKGDAESFINRKVAQLEAKINKLTKKLSQLEFLSNISKETPTEEDKVNEEGLPFIDIQEELDEEGNVISVMVNKKDTDIKASKNSTSNDLETTEPSKVELLESQFDDKVKRSSLAAAKGDCPHSALLDTKKELCENATINEDSERQTPEKESQLNGRNTQLSKIPASSEDVKQEKIVELKDEDSTNKSEFVDLMNDMEVLGPKKDLNDQEIEEVMQKIDDLDLAPDHKFYLKSMLTQEPSNEVSNHSNNENPSFDTKDLLELELLTDEASEDEIPDNIDDGDWDFELEDEINDPETNGHWNPEDDEDDDVEESDDNSNLDEEKRANYFKSSSDINNLLWKQILEHRNKHKSPGSNSSYSNDKFDLTESAKQPGKKKKSVSFADKLEIKEFNNREGEIVENRKVSKFKRNRIANHFGGSPINEPIEMADDKPVQDNVIEKNSEVFDSVDPGSTKNPNKNCEQIENKKTSIFKRNRMANNNGSHPIIESGDSLDGNPIQENVLGVNTEIFESDVPQGLDGQLGMSFQRPGVTEDLSNIPSSTSGFHLSDTDALARDYVQDESIDEGGRMILEKLDDFEEMNKMIEASELSQNDLHDNHVGEMEDEEDSDGEFDEGLVNEIVEHDFEDAPADIESEMMSQEISSDYQKLRQKLIYEKGLKGFQNADKESEFVPLDEEGAPKKISKFKASRLSHAIP